MSTLALSGLEKLTDSTFSMPSARTSTYQKKLTSLGFVIVVFKLVKTKPNVFTVPQASIRLFADLLRNIDNDS